MTDPGRITFSLNGQEIATDPDRLLIDVAEERGVFVPRFCYHPGMKSVAVCRMCLVHVEGQKKLLPACATPVTEGMVVNTVSEDAVQAQEGMLEFLLINHPLDCPICDRAGECPLQDQTYKHGPGSSRFVEPKRTFEKALAISDLVVLDRERCVLCWRCVRFADEVAGDRFIQLVDRGAGTQILTFKDDPFDSYFSGNTIQICPVGALTSKPYRFVSRPWDLKSAPSVCGYCSVGCPITNESREDKLVRSQAMPNDAVNEYWICDKGRYGYHYVDSKERLTTPLVRSDDRFEATTWGRALDVVSERLTVAGRVGVIAGGHLTTEDAFAIGKLARGVIGTPDIDSRIQDAGAPYEFAMELSGAAGSSATISDLDSADTVVWVGPDPKESLPVLFLRLRKAVIEKGARLIVVSPRRISLDTIATDIIRCASDEQPDQLDALDVPSGSTVVCWGPDSPGRDHAPIAAAAVQLAKRSGGGLLVCPPHAGSQGLIDMGVHPALGPGYAPLTEPGRDTHAILAAAAAGELDVLIVVGADLTTDFPDADLASRALAGDCFKVVVELFATECVAHADVVFPSVALAERDGTLTNLERRLQRVEALKSSPGTAAEPWRTCARIASALGTEWGWDTLEDVWTDIRASIPSHASLELDALSGQSSNGNGHTTYPTGYRAGAPFQTGQNWPLSWELSAFEASQRPGVIPDSLEAEGAPSPESARASSLEAEGAPSPERDSKTIWSSEGEGAQEAPPEDTALEAPAEATAPEAASAGAFVLLSGRLIYDRGRMVSHSAALRGLARAAYLEMNEADASALGLKDSDSAVVSANGFEVTLPVSLGDIIAGSVFVPYDQDGLAANRLMGGPNPRVEVRAAR